MIKKYNVYPINLSDLFLDPKSLLKIIKIMNVKLLLIMVNINVPRIVKS